MARLWAKSIAGAVGLLALLPLLVNLDPFLTAAPLAGVSQDFRTPPVAVNRTLKGDRQPVIDAGTANSSGFKPASWPRELNPPEGATRPKMPFGCDPAFSPVASPSLAQVYGRCAV